MGAVDKIRDIAAKAAAREQEDAATKYAKYQAEKELKITAAKEHVVDNFDKTLAKIAEAAAANKKQCYIHTYTHFEREGYGWNDTPVGDYFGWTYHDEMLRRLREEGFSVKGGSSRGIGERDCEIEGYIEVWW